MTTGELYTDSEIVSKLENGDQMALKFLFKKYYASLFRFAKEILRDETSADDAVQEVFVKLWEKRGNVQIVAVKSYLYMAVKNNCLNQIRLAGKKNWIEEDMEEDVKFSDYSVADALHAKNLESKIHHVIENLPPKCRLIFSMSRFEGKSYKEIAEELSLSVKTIENQMGKALHMLRNGVAPFLNELTVYFILGFLFEKIGV